MKSIYVRNLLQEYLKRKKMIVICLIIFILIFCAVGVRQAYPAAVSSSLAEEVQEYEEALQQYEDAIENTRENIEISQNQVDTQQKYCDNSVFMQIDPTNVQMASVQYMIRLPDMNTSTSSTQISYILNAWTTYINSGSIKSELASELGNISTEYLSELISCTTAGNTITLAVKHYDMDQAKDILQRLEQKMEAHTSAVVDDLGIFEMRVIDSSEYALADMNVQNTQNTNYNNLRTYKNSLADFKTKLVSQQTQKNNYEQQYKPTGVNTKSPKKTLLEYGALGVLAGIIIPFVVYALYYTISGRVKSKEELLTAELNVIASYHPKKGYTPSKERAALDLALLAEQKDVSAICLSVLGDDDLQKQVEGEFRQLLTEKNLEVLTVEAGKETPDQIQTMSEIKNSVLIIETGKTTYAQLEEQTQFCRRFGIAVWGCIVIE